jgi:RNA polymerase sigma factor (TIGR02999 family)
VQAPPSSEITALLRAWRLGDTRALDQLAPLVYHELRRIARRQLRHERRDHSLQATALVHEAYLKLTGLQGIDWQHRAHFFAIAARMMRRVLVDAARARRYQKRGACAPRIDIADQELPAPARSHDILALDDALEALARIDQRKTRVVELRFFGGFTLEETAATLGLSIATVERDWKFARTWLLKELRREP